MKTIVINSRLNCDYLTDDKKLGLFINSFNEAISESENPFSTYEKFKDIANTKGFTFDCNVHYKPINFRVLTLKTIRK